MELESVAAPHGGVQVAKQGANEGGNDGGNDGGNEGGNDGGTGVKSGGNDGGTGVKSGGNDGGTTGATGVTGLEVDENEPCPPTLIAATLKLYVKPFVRPVTVVEVEVDTPSVKVVQEPPLLLEN